jgi:hypothetical protein
MNSTSESAAVDEDIPGPAIISAACFSAMGLLACVQMFVLIEMTFRRRSGLYYWSLMGATFTQSCITFSTVLQTWILVDRLPGIPLGLSTFGYLFCPALGFLILYSRLHLLFASKRVLIFALTLTALEWTLAELPMALLQILSIIYPDSEKLAMAYKISWEIEEAMFAAVDFSLCVLYVLQIKRVWGHSEDGTKGVLRYVILMTVLFVLLDISWLVLQNTINYNLANSIEVG